MLLYGVIIFHFPDNPYIDKLDGNVTQHHMLQHVLLMNENARSFSKKRHAFFSDDACLSVFFLHYA